MAYVPAGGYPLRGPSASGGGGGGGGATSAAAVPTNNPSSSAVSATPFHGRNLPFITRLILGLQSDQNREQALALLVKNRQLFSDDVAILLWDSFGTMTLLLKEITSLYPALLSTHSISERDIARVSNAIVLLQSVASHPDTKMRFLKAHMPVYVYPFMNSTKSESSYERLRLSSLGVIQSLVKVDNAEVVEFLLFTQIFPSCLRCMEFGRTLSKTVATYIIYRILQNSEGLKYCFALGDRFLSVSRALGIMVENLDQEEEKHSPRLLRNIICCYHRLLESENDRARHILTSCIPSKLVDSTYIHILKESCPEALGLLQELVRNLQPTGQRSRTQPTSESVVTYIR
ncbi:Rcd1 [Corchorus capsularis]|uniref:Rcd1 n=1 Tax=Corchorus capsularis TaxID=210143 RepID=A0A1R3J344_COCAP|nr:Rcd1 [Corchorus capsularis]